MHSTNSAVKFNDTKNGTVRHLVSMEPSLFIDQIRSCKTSRTVSFLKTLRDLKGIDFQWKICNIKGSHDKHRSLQNDTGTQNTQMQQLKGVSYISQLNSRPGLKKATLCFQGGNSILVFWNSTSGSAFFFFALAGYHSEFKIPALVIYLIFFNLSSEKKTTTTTKWLKKFSLIPTLPRSDSLVGEGEGEEVLTAQVAQARNVSIGEHRHPSYGRLSI